MKVDTMKQIFNYTQRHWSCQTDVSSFIHQAADGNLFTTIYIILNWTITAICHYIHTIIFKKQNIEKDKNESNTMQ